MRETTKQNRGMIKVIIIIIPILILIIAGIILLKTRFFSKDSGQDLEYGYSITTEQSFMMGFMEIDKNNKFGNEIGYALELGARGARCSIWYIKDNFEEIFTPMAELYNLGFEIIGDPRPMPPGPPANYNDYKNKLRALIRDKKDIIKYWQIGNEPDLMWQRGGYTADDFVRFFLEAAEVIKDECSDCKIVLAGISNQYDSSSENYDFFEEVLEKIKKQSSDSKPFDVFDVHLYTDDGDYDRAERAVNDYKKLLSDTGYSYDIELVSTEFGTYSGKPKDQNILPFQSEEFQAEMLIKLYVKFFNAGVTKAFWTSVINIHKFGFEGQEGGYFDLVGLIYNGAGSYDIEHGIKKGTKKKAFYAYKTLASKIQDKTSVEEISENVFKFSSENDIIYIAWSDDKGKLPSSITGTVKVTDYLGNEKIMDASDVVLDSSPIFIGTSLDATENGYNPPEDESQQQGKCGDGFCDDLEKQTGLCPKDCGDLENGSEGGAQGRCGDRICDGPIEVRNCPQDCVEK